MRLSLANDLPEGQSDAYFARFDEARVYAGLRALHEVARSEGLAALDARDPLVRIGMEIDANGRVIGNGYSPFNLAWQAGDHPEWADTVAREVEALRTAIRDAHHAPLRFVIWAGLGGSAEDKSMYQAAGLLRRGPRGYVLDSTDPAKLKNIIEDIERRTSLSMTAILRSTLVAATASGRISAEAVVIVEKLAALYERYRIDGRPNFVCLSPPGSPLDQLARARGYLRFELQPDGAGCTASRHSGPLARGSLYTLALAKVNLSAWIEGAMLSEEDVAAAWRLASFIHAQGAAGRDKLTLLLPKRWAGAGSWTKQNFEESLGKCPALGLKVVLPGRIRLADFRSPRDPAQDRAFLAVQVKELDGPDSEKLAAVRRAGYPVAVLSLARGAPLSRYMQIIHYAVFGVAWLREMNFATRPGVELCQSIADRIFSEACAAGGVERTRAWQSMMKSSRSITHCGLLTLHYDRLSEVEPHAREAPALYASVLRWLAASRRVEYGELTFFGDTRYSAAGAAVRKRLERAAEQVFAERLKMPADVCEGPGVNHSVREMIVGHGRCFSTVVACESPEQYAPARYAPDDHLSQFLAAQIALAERGRPVVAITLKNMEQEALDALEDFFHRAAHCLKARM